VDYVFDTEFLDQGDRLVGISIGIVCVQDGREFYAVNRELPDPEVRYGWLGDNVWPYLPHAADGRLDLDHPSVLSPRQMRTALAEFFLPRPPEGDTHRLWAWYGSFDFVVLARFCGGFMHMPSWVPQQVRDLKALHLDKGRPELPVQDTCEHHPLHDARWNVAVGRALGAF
jgi:hypothetical protein